MAGAPSPGKMLLGATIMGVFSGIPCLMGAYGRAVSYERDIQRKAGRTVTAGKSSTE
jgi:hypothetical protein